MEKRIIKTIIKEKQREILLTNLVQRPIKFEPGVSYVLVGIRRAGKSYLMFQDIKARVNSGELTIQDCLYINFEDERLSSIQASELGIIIDCYSEIYDNPRPYIYLDEIQNVDGWEKFARRLADSKYRVMITGSNAKMLSGEIATTLGGRFIVREVFPFSFPEYLLWHGITLGKNWEYDSEIRTQVIKLFETYFRFGGFAETFALNNKREWINSLYQKILVGDIISRNNIRNGNAIRLLAKKLAASVMQPTTQTRLHHIVKSSGNNVSRNSIADYLGYMNDAYLTFTVSNFTDSLSERSTICKRYFYDNGILNNFLFEGETLLLENMVAIDLIKRYRQGENDGVYYYSKSIEVDFYVPDFGLAVQVCYSIDDLETRDRETRALVKLAEVFPVKTAVVVTFDQEITLHSDGLHIEVIPIWKWISRP